jgi:hypothetical protein
MDDREERLSHAQVKRWEQGPSRGNKLSSTSTTSSSSSLFSFEEESEIQEVEEESQKARKKLTFWTQHFKFLSAVAPDSQQSSALCFSQPCFGKARKR